MPLTNLPWSEDKWRENILRYQLRVKAEVIKRLAAKLECIGDFPTETPYKLSQLIGHSADIISQNLKTTPADQLMNVNFLLCLIAEHLRFVDRSRIANTPWSMIQGAEQFLKRQAGASSDFIIRPQWSYNYNLLGEFVETYHTNMEALTWIPIADWETSIGKLAQQKIYCLSFPRIERLNCLLHANWGHEIGHIIAQEWIKTNFAQLWQSQETKIRERIQQESRQELLQNPPPIPVDPLFVDLVIQELVADRANDAMQAAKRGLEELICDTIGVYLLGPAALAAATEFSAPLSMDESPLTCDMYPPWRYRIRLMVEMCKKDLQEQTVKLDGDEVKYPGAFIEPFWNWLKGTEYLIQNMADIQSLRSNISTREAYELIEAKWQQIRQQALQLLPQGPAKPYRLFERVRAIEDLVLKLEQDTPPNELGTWPKTSPAPFEDILNAAWVFKIKKMYQDPEWGSADDFEQLFRLVLKATEVSFVHDVFGGKLKNLE